LDGAANVEARSRPRSPNPLMEREEKREGRREDERERGERRDNAVTLTRRCTPTNAIGDLTSRDFDHSHQFA
jgi:hypothetical protein